MFTGRDTHHACCERSMRTLLPLFENLKQQTHTQHYESLKSFIWVIVFCPFISPLFVCVPLLK